MKIIKLIITILFSIITIKIFSQNCDFFSQNYNHIDFEDSTGFSILKNDTNFDNVRVFLNGEIHYQKSNPKVFIALLKYLYYNANVRIVVLELSTDYEFMINEYFRTGKLGIFKKSYNHKYTIPYIKELYNFYNTIKEVDTLIVKCIDYSNIWKQPISVLNMLLPENEPPIEIKDDIEKLKEINKNFRKNSYDSLVIFLSELFLKNRQVYGMFDIKNPYLDYFGTNYGLFFRILASLSYYWVDYDYENNIGNQHAREELLAFWISSFTCNINKYNIFCEFGEAHIEKTPISDSSFFKTNSLAYRLENDEIKTISINSYYQYLYHRGTFWKDFHPEIPEKDLECMLKISKNKYTIFDVPKNDSTDLKKYYDYLIVRP